MQNSFESFACAGSSSLSLAQVRSKVLINEVISQVGIPQIVLCADLIPSTRLCSSIDEMNQEWATRSRKAAGQFFRETLLYGFVIFILLTLARWAFHLKFADNLFEVWAVSTVIFAPMVWGARHLFIEAFRWRR